MQTALLGGDPLVERLIKPGQILQERAAVQVEQGGLPASGGAERHGIDPDPVHVEQQMLPAGAQAGLAVLGEEFLQLMDALPQRGPCLFALPFAPQQGGDPFAQHRPSPGQHQNGEQAACLADFRQLHRRPTPHRAHLPEQAQS